MAAGAFVSGAVVSAAADVSKAAVVGVAVVPAASWPQADSRPAHKTAVHNRDSFLFISSIFTFHFASADFLLQPQYKRKEELCIWDLFALIHDSYEKQRIVDH